MAIESSTDLRGRTVVITGAARGVGLAIARCCARHGAQLIIGDILDDLGRQAVEQLKSEGAQARFVPVDLASPSSIEAFAQDIADHEGHVHGLVNNAAIATNVGGHAFEDIELALWDRVMTVNVRGTWLMTRSIVRLMPDGAEARIVNMASDTALWGPPRLLAYVSSKGAVLSMTRSMARELGPRRIGVVALAPGLMKNEATEYVPASRHAEYEEGRAVPGAQMPEDIVEVTAFLLSAGALVLTGQTLPVNNGFIYN